MEEELFESNMSRNKNWREIAIAYALGYYDGRAVGVEDSPYGGDELRHAYSAGYQRGVSAYCEVEHGEEE